MQYSYWLIRYVPDAARGEFVNVGIIAGRDGGDWALRRVRSLRRASRLGGNASALEPWLSRIERIIADHQAPPLFGSLVERPLSGGWLSHLSGRLNNAVQISESAPVEADSAEEAASFLFPFLVAETSFLPAVRTRSRLVSDLRDHYESDANLTFGQGLVPRPRARVGRQRGRFDFAVVADRVSQLSQVWSFDMKDTDRLEQEIQSWSFLVERLRNDGGKLSVKGDYGLLPETIDSEVPISVVYLEPSDPTPGERTEVYLAAREAWEHLRVDAVPSNQLNQVAKDARDLVGAR
jgi:hypothetical protein